MTLPSSGAISLNDMHIEAGGSSGTLCSINDSDIRALIGKASGVQMSFSEWYVLGSWTVTQGDQYSPYASAHGYSLIFGVATGSFGSITTPTSFTDSNSTSRTVYGFHRTGASGYNDLTLQLSGSSTTGFTTLYTTLNGTAYALPRSGANIVVNTGGTPYVDFQWNSTNGYFGVGTTDASNLIAEFPYSGGSGTTTSFSLR